jgi:hypothetical protein
VSAGEIRCGDQAIMAGADHNSIVWHGQRFRALESFSCKSHGQFKRDSRYRR